MPSAPSPRGHTGDACVIPEPTDRRVVTAAAGALTFRLEVPGRAAHGSSRAEGVSALEAFLPVHAALRELERERCADPDPLMAGYALAYPLSIGTVRAGRLGEHRARPARRGGPLRRALGEDPATARAALEAAVETPARRDPWLRDHPVRVTWWGGQFASGALPAGSGLLPLVQDAWADATGGTGPRHAASPTAATCGSTPPPACRPCTSGPATCAGRTRAASSSRCDEVEEVAAALALTVVRYCGTR